MPINQNEISNLLSRASPSSQSDRVFMVEGGNMMTAIDWFRRITGQALSLADLSRNKATGGFFIHTYNGTVNGAPVNVNLRGGSSSTITTEKHVLLMTQGHQYLGEIDSSSTTAGCPTLDITNPQNLTLVPSVAHCQGRIEIKFTTTYVHVQ